MYCRQSGSYFLPIASGDSDIRPAATMISAGLSDPRMKAEIGVTARLRGDLR